MRCILYPGQKIVVVAPTKPQSLGFVKKIREFLRDSPNLSNEIDVNNIKTGTNECEIPFRNGSMIFTKVHSENARGERANILIVDEFAKADEKIINDVFVPMLTSPRIPPYASLTPEELATIPEEVNRQYYLSSIRGADEWSFKRLLNYLDYMLNGDKNYMVVSLPYHLGVKNRYISKMLVEQGFRNAIDDYESQIAEYLAIPIRGSGNTFFKYSDMSKARDNVKCITAMSDDEYILYKDNLEKWPYYVEKMPNEIRILAMDIALIESAKNDNSMMWIIRLIPDGGKYKKILAYGESMHGLNSTIQGKRAKQLFYETQCDYFVVDAQGSGVKSCAPKW